MDKHSQTIEDRFERIGWTVMAAVIFAACLGLFGKGPLSHASAQNPAFRLEYEHLLHFGDLTTLRLETAGLDAEENSIMVAIPNAYLHRFRIHQINPTPETLAAGDETVFWFSVAKPGVKNSLLFHIEPETMGMIEGQIRMAGRVERFRQFVFP